MFDSLIIKPPLDFVKWRFWLCASFETVTRQLVHFPFLLTINRRKIYILEHQDEHRNTVQEV
jgi:hypothetical protein